MTTPEGKVKNMVKRKFNAALGDDLYLFMPVQSGYGAKTLDFLGNYRGLFFAVETKAPGKKPTALQEVTMAAIRAAGGVVFVVDDEASCAEAISILRERATNCPIPRY